LWSSVIQLIIVVFFLRSGLSRAMRNRAESWTRRKPLQTFLYWTQFIIITTLLTFPFTVYTDYFREHQYNLSNQTFGAWIGEQGKSLALSVIIGGLVVMALYGVVRRFPRTWNVWGAVVGIVFLVFGILIAPVFIVPLFNKVTPLTDARIRDPILSMARANGIEAKDVFVIDASKQSKRISANVSGIGNTMRITLNDNLLNRSSPQEIQAVMGHEMGHYVLNHVYKGVTFFTIVIVLLFVFIKWAFGWTTARWGEKWGVRDIGDTAGLPIVAGALTVFFFLTAPLLVTYTRTAEAEADMFGLNASRQPDGFAQAALQLSEYRKLDPGPVEEFIFFDHPSGRNRIYRSMVWKAEHLSDYTSSQIR
ncbi:MAG TPA: M48 family metallopeptidase, partial [Gemmatimonadaceae bacterium]|nr:M48 family metallopeptidase [Gemmatimonadaceae bacterium]